MKNLLSLLLMIFLSLNLLSMENASVVESDNHFTNLDPELKDYILRIGIIALIKQNDIFNPFKGVFDFVLKFSQINLECNELAHQVTLRFIKAIAKEHFVRNEFKYLSEEELNEKLKQLVIKDEQKDLTEGECILTSDIEKEGAELIMSGARCNCNCDVLQLTMSVSSSPFNLAVYKRFNKLAKLMISYGANIYFRDSQGCDPLILTIIADNVEMARVLLNQGANVNTKDIQGFSASFLSAFLGNNEILEELLKQGAQVNNSTGSSINQQKPLIIALSNICLGEPNVKTIQLLLHYGADINTKDGDSKNAVVNFKRFWGYGMFKFLKKYKHKKQDDKS